MKKTTRTWMQMILVFLTILSIFLSGNNISLIKNTEPQFVEGEENFQTSGFWILNPIHIDDSGTSGNGTWIWAVGQEWCYGYGNSTHPYVIENITVDAEGMSGITIINSTKHFIIKNCTIYNSGIFGFYGKAAAILLINVSNGLIMENNCSNNKGSGIQLMCDSDDNQIVNNSLSNNEITHISLYGNSYWDLDQGSCDNNLIINNTGLINRGGSYAGNAIEIINGSNNWIINNTMRDSKGFGLTLSYGSCFNHIINNTFSNSDQSGVGMYMDSHYNIIKGNLIETNVNRGIQNWLSNHTLIEGNQIYQFSSNGEGIQAEDCFNLTIKNNYLEYFTQIGIYIYNVKNLTIRGNKIHNAGYWGLSLSSCNDTIIYENNFTDYIHSGEASIAVSGCRRVLTFNNTFATQFDCMVSYGGADHYWNNSIIGNRWSNYGGKDVDDDGVGDTPHGTAVSVGGIRGYDYKPIFWDAPRMNIISPIYNIVYNRTAPDFEVNVYEGIKNHTWYVVNDSSEKIFFTSMSGKINQSLWDTLGNGSLTITFFVNDSRGWSSSAMVEVQRDKFIKNMTIFTPSNGDEYYDPPEYNLWVNTTFLSNMWYTLNLTSQKYFFSSNGTINATGWYSFGEGVIVITFYLNQTNGHIESYTRIVLKIKSDDNSNLDIDNGVPSYDIFLLLGIILVGTVLINRKRYKSKISI